MVNTRTARLQPIREINHPSEIVPIKAPRQLTDPIHETSSFDKGPEAKGDLSDVKNGRAGDTQPIIAPCENMIKLAI